MTNGQWELEELEAVSESEEIYITIQVKPTFAFDPYFQCPPHLLQICSKMRPISPKTMLYQNDRVDETVVGT